MDGVGTFSNTLRFIGMLSGTQLINRARFEVSKSPSANKFLAYTGNRVNLYIVDGIKATSRTNPADLSIGISVGWSFLGRVEGETFNAVFRGLDLDDQPDNPLENESGALSMIWCESKIEYAASSPGVGFQVGEIAPNNYMFPKTVLDFNGMIPITGASQARGYYCIPLVARADFMHVNFWCEPSTWVGHSGVPRPDCVYIYALSGSDVAGSQRIGGGHG
jgi:hypothetical protein